MLHARCMVHATIHSVLPHNGRRLLGPIVYGQDARLEEVAGQNVRFRHSVSVISFN